VTRKVKLYAEHLPALEKHFKTQAVVLFVLDSKDALARATQELKAPFAYFVDLQTFLRVRLGRQLTAPVYIWGYDGKEYPIKDDR
jgi:hypothetical protein